MGTGSVARVGSWVSAAEEALNSADAEGAEESGDSMGGKSQERGAEGLRALRSEGGGGGSGKVAEWQSGEVAKVTGAGVFAGALGLS